MRFLLAAFALPLAACGGGSDGGNEGAANTAQPAPRPTAPAPRTPVLDVDGVAANQAEWIGPREAPGARPTAPYGNLLDEPVVDAPPAR